MSENKIAMRNAKTAIETGFQV